MASHCPHCSDLNNWEDIHPDLLCPGCLECERLRGELTRLSNQAILTVKSWKDRLTAEVGLKEQECERLRARLAKAERVVEALNPNEWYGDAVAEALEEWEKENG